MFFVLHGRKRDSLLLADLEFYGATFLVDTRVEDLKIPTSSTTNNNAQLTCRDREYHSDAVRSEWPACNMRSGG